QDDGPDPRLRAPRARRAALSRADRVGARRRDPLRDHQERRAPDPPRRRRAPPTRASQLRGSLMLPVETVGLEHGAASARLAPAPGGMVTRFSVGGEDVLFLDESTLADPKKNVRGGVPVLFPIGGPLSPDKLPGATAPLSQHGFARNLPWRVASSGGDRAVLVLEADE